MIIEAPDGHGVRVDGIRGPSRLRADKRPRTEGGPAVEGGSVPPAPAATGEVAFKVTVAFTDGPGKKNNNNPNEAKASSKQVSEL